MTDVNGVSWLVGSDAAGESGRVGGEEANARFRTWTYSVTLPGTVVEMATRRDTGGATPANAVPDIRVIAVKANGMALEDNVEVTINKTKP